MPPKLSDNTAISFCQRNPKRAGTKVHERYEQYKAAKTIEEALRLGAARGDISNDIKQGFCTVPGDADAGRPGPPAAAEEAVAAGGCGQKRKAAAAIAEAPGAEAVPAATESSPGDAKRRAAAAVEPAVALAPAVGPAPTPLRSSRDEVDLSFAKLEGKPLQFVKRMMNEARKLLSAKGLEEAEKGGYRFHLGDRDNLSKWSVQLRDMNPDGHLAKDLARYQLEPCVDLEISLPDGFPLAPPFARVVYPQLSGGYVFDRGGICFEPLTAKGWSPSMSLPALVIAIKGILDYGEVRVRGVGNRQTRTIPQYTEAGARKDTASIAAAHRDGERSTYAKSSS